MTRLLFSLSLLFGQFAFGQTTYPFTKIIFSYSKGHSSWNEPGVYGISEQIEFTPNSDTSFSITQFFKISYSAGSYGKSFIKDTTKVSRRKFSEIDEKYIRNWLTQLNTQKENFTETFIKPRLTIPTDKEISNVAKSINKNLFFDKEFNEERRDVTRKIKSLYQLDSFLILTRTNLERLMLFTDNWNSLRVEVIKASDTTIYQCQFFVPLGQPVFRDDHKDFQNEKQVFNLEINCSAQKVLPKNSLTYKILDINNIKKLYIKWCLEEHFNRKETATNNGFSASVATAIHISSCTLPGSGSDGPNVTQH